MVAYNFQARFEAKIRAGDKTTTIRAPRLRGHVAPGAEFRLYTGQRSKACRLLGTAVADDVRRVRLNLKHGLVDREARPARVLRFEALDPDRVARREGFRDFDELAAFWLQAHSEAWSWEGWLIDWGLSFVGTR